MGQQQKEHLASIPVTSQTTKAKVQASTKPSAKSSAGKSGFPWKTQTQTTAPQNAWNKGGQRVDGLPSGQPEPETDETRQYHEFFSLMSVSKVQWAVLATLKVKSGSGSCNEIKLKNS